MGSEDARPEPGEETMENPREEPGCHFQEAAALAERAARLGLEAAAVPLAFLPGRAREQLRHRAAGTLRGLAVGPRILSGILDEVARDVEVPMAESDLGTRRREETSTSRSGPVDGSSDETA